MMEKELSGEPRSVVLVLVWNVSDKHLTAVVSLAQVRGWINVSNTCCSDSLKWSNEDRVGRETDYCHIPRF